ncbi:hypothetical protein JHK82_050906 [Glycine max]|nr:hypothetical protein JHK86_050761 [Glycine max]KAG4936684.1 hypothetical protein JHK85_051603 [Glycine max]KAG5092128.1 hypothetical protein JHK82_050906 [Glycine max]
MLLDSFEKLSFLRRLAKGVAQAFSAFPYFMSTISTMSGIFLSFFSLTGVLTIEHLSEPNMDILYVFLPLIFVFWGMPLPDTRFFDAEEMSSNSLVIKELIVAVVLRLMDPPPPFIPYRL